MQIVQYTFLKTIMALHCKLHCSFASATDFLIILQTSPHTFANIAYTLTIVKKILLKFIKIPA